MSVKNKGENPSGDASQTPGNLQQTQEEIAQALASNKKQMPDSSIFVGWSGKNGHELAKFLSPWLKRFFGSAVDVRLDSEVLRKGDSVDIKSIKNVVGTPNVAIFCLSEDGLGSDWVLFEAGIATNTAKLLIPFLVGVSKDATEIKKKWDSGPFKALIRGDSSDTTDLTKMLIDINKPGVLVHSINEDDFEQKCMTLLPELVAKISELQQTSEKADEDEIDISSLITNGDMTDLLPQELKILAVMREQSTLAQSYSTATSKIKAHMLQYSYSEGEFKLALRLLRKRLFIEKDPRPSPMAYKMTGAGVKYLNVNMRDYGFNEE